MKTIFTAAITGIATLASSALFAQTYNVPANGAGLTTSTYIGSTGAGSNSLKIASSSSSNDISFFTGAVNTSSNEKVTIKGNGLVGIGTTNPEYKLHVLTSATEGGILISDNITASKLGFGIAPCAGCYSSITQIGDPIVRALGGKIVITNNGGAYTPTADKIVLATGYSGANDVVRLRILGNGKVGIGDVTPAQMSGDYNLFVSTGIITEKLQIAVKGVAPLWPDYVFEENYKLKSLSETEAYINKNKHLPGIPSAQEIATSGINVAEMDAKLLEKIEELTLHVIALEKQNQKLEKQNGELSTAINELKK